MQRKVFIDLKPTELLIAKQEKKNFEKRPDSPEKASYQEEEDMQDDGGLEGHS